MLEIKFHSCNDGDAEEFREDLQKAVGNVEKVLINPVTDLNEGMPGFGECFTLTIGESNDSNINLSVDLDYDMSIEYPITE